MACASCPTTSTSCRRGGHHARRGPARAHAARREGRTTPADRRLSAFAGSRSGRAGDRRHPFRRGLRRRPGSGGHEVRGWRDLRSGTGFGRLCEHAGRGDRYRVVDFVLPPRGDRRQARFLARRLASDRRAHARADAAGIDLEAGEFEQVFALLRDAFRVDFSAYKLPTIRRRLTRRMLLRRSADLTVVRRPAAGNRRRDRGSVPRHPHHGHQFFREPETFALLRELVFPAILRGKSNDGDSLRIWVPGSRQRRRGVQPGAITALDVMAELRPRRSGQDLRHRHQRARLKRARRARTRKASPRRSPPICCDATSSPQTAAIRSARPSATCASSRATTSPLIRPSPTLPGGCRNWLIYLGPTLQRRVIASLHYGLAAEGYLVLGRSESIAGSARLFDAVDKKHKTSESSLVCDDRPPRSSGAARRARCRLSLLRARSVRWRRRKPRAFASRPTRPCSPRLLRRESRLMLEYGIVEFRGDTAPWILQLAGQAVARTARHGP